MSETIPVLRVPIRSTADNPNPWYQLRWRCHIGRYLIEVPDLDPDKRNPSDLRYQRFRIRPSVRFMNWGVECMLMPFSSLHVYRKALHGMHILSPHEARLAMRRVLSGPTGRAALRKLRTFLDELEGRRFQVRHYSQPDQAPWYATKRLEELLQTHSLRRLVVLEEPPRVVHRPRVEEPEQPQESADSPSTSTEWIEIELLDEEDRPVFGVQYELTYSDGTTHKGKLDARGFARVPRLNGGEYTVLFPEVHEDDWF